MKYNSKNAETLAKKQKSEIPFSDWDDNLVFFFLIQFMRIKKNMKIFVAVLSLWVRCAVWVLLCAVRWCQAEAAVVRVLDLSGRDM